MSSQRDMGYAKMLSLLIRKETVSQKKQQDKTKFFEFHDLLRQTFPKLFATVKCQVFDGSLLLIWSGENAPEKPILIMNHHDVVEAVGNWTHPPFSGEISDGKLWGRGSLDTKSGLFVMLRAAEELIEEGFTPSRDVYFVTTCNEETDNSGADKISTELLNRGIRFHMVLDEGGMIVYDPIGGADGKFAMIGIGEKGCVDLKFTAKSSGGHASTPPKNSPLVRLGKFMAAAEKSRIFTSKVTPETREMLKRFSPKMKGVMKLVCSHPLFFSGLLSLVMPAISPTAGAMLKTTLAFTMASGSDGSNVLPHEAWVMGNMRYSRHQGFENSLEAITRLAKKFDIETEIIDPGIKSELTDFTGEPFRLIEKNLSKIFPDVTPVPYVMTGASDSSFFGRVSENCIRFLPIYITDEQFDSIHGIDENISIENLAKAVDFYKAIIKEV